MDAERGRWLLIASAVIINLAMGSIYAWSVFVDPLAGHYTEALGQAVSANQVLLPFSIFLVCFAVAMPLAGRYIEACGPRAVAMLGGVLTGAGWLLASMATSLAMLYVVYGVIGGAGVGVTYGALLTVAARWFPDRRGTAMGLTLLGFGASPVLMATIAGRLLAQFDVMAVFRIFGVAILATIVLLSLPLALPPPGWRPAGHAPPPAPGPEPGPAACPALHGLTRSEMLRTSSFYGLWICFFIGCVAGLMAISIAIPVGTEIVGIEAGFATLLVGLFAIFNGGGRPLFGALTDRFTPRNTAILSFALITLASLTLWRVPTTPVYIIAFAILWGSLGAWPAIAPTSTAAFFGMCDYPRCYGVVYLAYGAGALAGPMLAGSVRTATGSYLGVFPYVAALAAAGIVIAHLLMHPPGKEAGTTEEAETA
ncbi:MAG: OFA family MFS transporter [Methanomicrobiaceae archaeon]|nr:OFA family MFS transporter [Methanomicrobiaceae archaeon]